MFVPFNIENRFFILCLYFFYCTELIESMQSTRYLQGLTFNNTKFIFNFSIGDEVESFSSGQRAEINQNKVSHKNS